MDKLFSEWGVQEALQNQFPMHYAAKRGDIAVMKYLIGRGCVVNCSNLEQVTPLHEAATQGHIDAVQFLLDEGAWVKKILLKHLSWHVALSCYVFYTIIYCLF